MAETTRSAPSPLAVEFNAFLFAPIFEERSEAQISVVSALARLDLDPWQEAAELAQLPRDTAGKRLASLFERLPGGPSVHPDGGSTTARLIELLPSPKKPETSLRETLPVSAANRAALAVVVLMVYLMAWVFLIDYVTGPRAPLPSDKTHASVSQAPAKPMPAPSSNR